MVSVFFQKKIGVNRTPKFLVDVANFFVKRPIDIANELFRGNQTSLKHILCFSADIKQSFTSSRIEPPHLNVLAYKIYPCKNIYFCHHQKRFTCDPPLSFISRSVQLAHSTKDFWENENSIE